MAKKCVIISCFNHYETRTKKLIEYYTSIGYTVFYVVMAYNHFEKAHTIQNIPNTIYVEVPEYKKNLSFKRLFSHFLFSQKVAVLLKSINPDLIYSIFPPNTLVRTVAKYKKKSGCKVIFDCYDMWPESFPTKRFAAIFYLPFKIWGSIRNRYIDNADLVLGVSRTCVDALKLITNKEVRLLMPQLNTGYGETYNNNVETLSFCYLGNINHITDIELLVSLLHSIAGHKKLILHIIGEGQYLHYLQERLTHKNISIECHGVIFDVNEKNKIFKICNFGVNVPKEEIQSTMSLKSVEYMSHGLPFINSAGGDSHEIVSTYNLGINIDKQDISTTAQKICSLTSTDLSTLNHNVISFYNDKFSTQDLNTILKI